MQLDEVSAALNWNVRLPLGKFLLVRDTVEVDGGFMAHHLMDQFIRNNESLCLVSFANTLEHYTAVSKKLGRSLAQLSADQLHFIDGLTLGFSWLERENPNEVRLLSTEEFKQLYIRIKQIVENSSKHLCILIDDLSVLVNAAQSPRDVFQLLKYLRNLLSNQMDADDLEDREEAQMLTELTHLADEVFDVAPLITGYSKDIHGRIDIHSTAIQPPPQPAFHFIVTENGVKVFVPGAH